MTNNHITDIITDAGDGAWLVIKNGNCTSRRPLKPDFEELDAALNYLLEGMVQAMSEKSKLRPKSVRMSKKEIRAWNAYEKIMGKDKPQYFEYASLYEIAEAGRDYVRKRIVTKKRREKREEIVDMGNPILLLDIP